MKKPYLKYSSYILCIILLMGCQTESPDTPIKLQLATNHPNLFDNGTLEGKCSDGNCLNGAGTFVIDGGYEYKGGFKDGQADGQGRFDMPEGHYKEGTWKKGRLVKGREFNAFDSTLYLGNFVSLDIDSIQIDVPHQQGIFQYSDGQKIQVVHDSGEVVLMGGMQYTAFYSAMARTPCLPSSSMTKAQLKKKPLFNANYQRKYRLPAFDKVRLFGKATRFGIMGLNKYERLYGRMIRALRFQNITQAVEKRYGLPDNVILAMVMIESSGMLHLPNAGDDGGLGLAHMQGIVAENFDLATVCDKATGCRLVCRRHGRFLRKQIEQKNYQDAALIPIDNRFHPILNLDAVGRMLAYHQRRPRKLSPPIKQGVYYYAGAHNFYKSYWRTVKYYMGELNNPRRRSALKWAFNKRNQKVDVSFDDYINSFHQLNYNYGLQEYMDLCRKTLNPVSPDIIAPTDLNTPCYIVAVFSTADQLRAASMVREFINNDNTPYPMAGYIWLPTYPNTYLSNPPQLYQVYLRVHKNPRQIIKLAEEVRRDLPQFSDVFIKELL